MRNDPCTAFLSAADLCSLIGGGASLDVAVVSDSGERLSAPWRALLFLTSPRQAKQFLDIVISPSVHVDSERLAQNGMAAHSSLIVCALVHPDHDGLFVSHPLASIDECLAFVPAEQVSRAIDQGAQLDVFDSVAPGKRADGLRRATLDLREPRTVAMFLDVLIDPGAVLGPTRREQAGIAAPQKLQVFGFIQQEQGGFFVSEFVSYS